MVVKTEEEETDNNREEENVDEQCYENTTFMGEENVLYEETWIIIIHLFIVNDRMKPVPIDDFGAHVQRMHADRDRWFEMEYNVSLKTHHKIIMG